MHSTNGGHIVSLLDLAYWTLVIEVRLLVFS